MIRQIIHIDEEPFFSGKVGIVDHIDDIVQIHGSWGGRAVVPGVDIFELMEE